MTKPLKRAVFYYVVDAVTFVSNIFIAWVLVRYGVHYLAATTLGFIFQTVVAFFLNKIWTFNKPHLRVSRGLFITSLVQVSAFLIVIVLTAVGVEYFKLPFLIVRIVSGIIAGISAFILDSRYTFGVSPFK